jgi:hypothetical protein
VQPAVDVAPAQPTPALLEIRTVVKATRESLLALRGTIAGLEGRLAMLEAALPEARRSSTERPDAAPSTTASRLAAWMAAARSALARLRDAWTKRYALTKRHLLPGSQHADLPQTANSPRR